LQIANKIQSLHIKLSILSFEPHLSRRI